MSEELSGYGVLDFIGKVLGLMFQNPEFLRRVSPVIKPEYFDTKVDQIFAEIFINFAKECPKSTLTRMVIYTELKKLIDDKRVDPKENPLYMTRFATILKPVLEVEYVEKKVFKFLEEKAMEVALKSSMALLKKGDLDGITEEINKARTAIVADESEKFEYCVLAKDIDDYVRRLKDPEEEDKRKGVTTGIIALDEYMLGNGIRPQEMFIDLGPPGRGKTNALLNKAIAATLKGEDLLYYTLEVNRMDYEDRYVACLTGVPVKRLRAEADKVGKRLKRVEECFPKKGKIIMGDLPSKYLRPSTIVRDYKRFKEEADINGVVIDYADIMMSDKKFKSEDKRLELGNIYLELRGLAKEFNFYVYSASQGNRGSISKLEIGLDGLSEDFSKAFTADYVVSLSQSSKEKLVRTAEGTGTGAMRLYLAKNRTGTSGVGVEIMTDYTCCRLSKYDWDVFDKEVYFGI